MEDYVMDTAKPIPINIVENSEDLHLANLTDSECSLINDYVLLTRDVIEANQLFESFYFSLLNLRNCFTLNSNDTIIRTDRCPDYGSDFVAINSLVICYISSAKTLTEFLRATAQVWLKNDNNTDSFNLYCSQKYDNSFIYRLFINLRNYMQHGYLPISLNIDKYCFDLHQILNTPHFKIDGPLKKDIENFISRLDKPGDEIANLAMTHSLANFTIEVIDIYKHFLSCFKPVIQHSYDRFIKLISDKPSIVCDYHKQFKGFIIYKLDNKELHAIDINDNPNSMIIGFQKYTSDIYFEEKQNYDELNKYFVYNGDSI